jgi:hypothetical protein
MFDFSKLFVLIPDIILLNALGQSSNPNARFVTHCEQMSGSMQSHTSQTTQWDNHQHQSPSSN